MFLAVAGLATFGASCSSDDSKDNGGNGGKEDNGPGNGSTQLVLTADKTSVNEGDTVTFTVKADKKEVDADLYIQGTDVKINKSHKFEEKGQYKIVAKKKDYKDSSVVTITVKGEDEPGVEKKLVLTPSKTEAFTGDVITFTVKDEDGANVNGFTVKHNDAVVPNGLFTATEAGTYKFVASKDGYVASEEVSVVIKEKVVPQGNYIQVGDKVGDVTMKQLIVNGRKINNKWVPYVYEEQGVRYIVFTYDMGTVNAAGTQWEVKSTNIVVGFQPAGDITFENMVWPANAGEGADIVAAAAYDFTAGTPVQVIFDVEADVENLDFPTSTTENLFIVKLMNDEGAVNFDGSFGENFYWNEVDANGVEIPRGASKAKNNLVNTNVARR
ncbi:hypothetical protein [Myroides sp. DW712]|uniref:hypothetical protein n=1 Tax=Myroides sp. DW712 TaxID=3389800 RepID=UPI0039797892